MAKWQARTLAVVIALVWLFGLMFVEGILLMSAAHADDTGQRIALAIVGVVAVVGIGLGTRIVCLVWRSWRPHRHATHT